MTIKTVCKLTLKKEEGCVSYTDYKIYPLVSMFASSDDAALISYINKMTSPHIEVQGCHIMEITLADSDTLRFYRVKGRNTKFKHDVVEDYLVLDVPYMDL